MGAPQPRALILRSPGANCDVETQFACERAGALAERLHINRLREQPYLLQRFQILVIPGGFTYGDDVAAGKILANQLVHYLADALHEFRDSGRLVLGICNGFQALIRAGLLIPPDEDGHIVTLAHNDSGRLEDRWVHLHVASNRCPFLKGVERLYLPIAHGEGKLQAREAWMLQGLDEAGQLVLKYVDEAGKPGPFPINPNGSERDVAGICDISGQVLGLMPHPERHVLPTQHPQWMRRPSVENGDGLLLFENAVDFFK